MLAVSLLSQVPESCLEGRGLGKLSHLGEILPVGKVIVATIGWSERKHKQARLGNVLRHACMF